MLLLSRHGSRSWWTCCGPGLPLWLLPLLCRPGPLLELLPLLCRPRPLLGLLPLLCRPGLLLSGSSLLWTPALPPLSPCMGGSANSEKCDQDCCWAYEFHVCNLKTQMRQESSDSGLERPPSGELSYIPTPKSSFRATGQTHVSSGSYLCG